MAIAVPNQVPWYLPPSGCCGRSFRSDGFLGWRMLIIVFLFVHSWPLCRVDRAPRSDQRELSAHV